jgi:hypothetical protein
VIVILKTNLQNYIQESRLNLFFNVHKEYNCLEFISELCDFFEKNQIKINSFIDSEKAKSDSLIIYHIKPDIEYVISQINATTPDLDDKIKEEIAHYYCFLIFILQLASYINTNCDIIDELSAKTQMCTYSMLGWLDALNYQINLMFYSHISKSELSMLQIYFNLNDAQEQIKNPKTDDITYLPENYSIRLIYNNFKNMYGYSIPNLYKDSRCLSQQKKENPKKKNSIDKRLVIDISILVLIITGLISSLSWYFIMSKFSIPIIIPICVCVFLAASLLITKKTIFKDPEMNT